MVSTQSYIRAEIECRTFPAPAKAQAFSVYAIANSRGLVPEMEHAPQLTMDQPMTFESLGEELRLFNAQALSDLIRYRVATKRRRRNSWDKRIVTIL